MKRVRYLDRVVDNGNRSAASMRYGLSCRSYISTSNKKFTTNVIWAIVIACHHICMMEISNCHSHLVCLLFTLWPFLCLVTFLMFFITCYI